MIWYEINAQKSKYLYKCWYHNVTAYLLIYRYNALYHVPVMFIVREMRLWNIYLII